jgi:hypothetical protein
VWVVRMGVDPTLLEGDCAKPIRSSFTEANGAKAAGLESGRETMWHLGQMHARRAFAAVSPPVA